MLCVPNRMFKNVDGKRFSEVTASSGTGLSKKGMASPSAIGTATAMSTYLLRWEEQFLAINITTFSSKIQGTRTTG